MKYNEGIHKSNCVKHAYYGEKLWKLENFEKNAFFSLKKFMTVIK